MVLKTTKNIKSEIFSTYFMWVDHIKHDMKKVVFESAPLKFYS